MIKRSNPIKNSHSCLLAHQRASSLNASGVSVGLNGATMVISALMLKMPKTMLKRKTSHINISNNCDNRVFC